MAMPEDPELDRLISSLSNGAGGPSGLTNGMLKMLWSPLRLSKTERQTLAASHSTDEINSFESAAHWTTSRDAIRSLVQSTLLGHVPDHALRGQVYAIPKRDNSADLADLRPITLQEVTWKLVTGLLTHRMEDRIDTHNILRGRNYGFCRRESTDPVLYALRSSLEDAHQFKKPIFGGLGDIASAYDSVSWHSQELSLNVSNSTSILKGNDI
eukprot:tig00000293_g23868.t1